MARSVADIIDDTQTTVANSGLGRVIRGTLIGGPIATVGYALSYGIDSLRKLITNPVDQLGLGSADVIGSFSGGISLLLEAGSGGSAAALSEYGVVAWIVAIGIIIGGLWVMGKGFDRMDIDTFTGIDIPLISRFSGASADEEE